MNRINKPTRKQVLDKMNSFIECVSKLNRGQNVNENYVFSELIEFVDNLNDVFSAKDKSLYNFHYTQVRISESKYRDWLFYIFIVLSIVSIIIFFIASFFLLFWDGGVSYESDNRGQWAIHISEIAWIIWLSTGSFCFGGTYLYHKFHKSDFYEYMEHLKKIERKVKTMTQEEFESIALDLYTR